MSRGEYYPPAGQYPAGQQSHPHKSMQVAPPYYQQGGQPPQSQSRNDRTFRINLHSAHGEFDNKASVEVECERPDEVVERMLAKLADKFPPDSVVTIEKGAGALPPEEPIPRPQPQPTRAPPPQPPVVETRSTYVEVPVARAVERPVPKKEVIELEKRIPYEIVEKPVPPPQPQIKVIDKYQEVDEIEEVVKYVPRKQIVEVPKEVISYVPKVETRVVEKQVQIPGREQRMVEVPYTVEKTVVVPTFKDVNVPCVVGQRLVPSVEECDDIVEVDVKKYVPYMVPVDVYVPRPVHLPIIWTGKEPTEEQTAVLVPPAQYNSLLMSLNPQMTSDPTLSGFIPSIKDPDGTIPLLPGGTVPIPPLPPDQLEQVGGM